MPEQLSFSQTLRESVRRVLRTVHASQLQRLLRDLALKPKETRLYMPKLPKTAPRGDSPGCGTIAVASQHSRDPEVTQVRNQPQSRCRSTTKGIKLGFPRGKPDLSLEKAGMLETMATQHCHQAGRAPSGAQSARPIRVDKKVKEHCART